MNMDLLILNGYGQFVWPAFLFTIASCFFLYLKSRKELQKNEEIFIQEFGKLQTTEIKIEKRKEIIKKLYPVVRFKYLKS